MRRFLGVIFFVAALTEASAQAPGVDPRGLAVNSAPVIIGVVEEPLQIVFRPDKLPQTSSPKRQPNGRFIVELPQKPLDHLVGYIFHVRVQEVLKGDEWVRVNETIRVFAPFKLEGGVSLPARLRFLLVLAPFVPKAGDFEKTSVISAGQSLYRQGRPFDLRSRYYVVASEANGAVPLTEKNKKLIKEIRAAIGAN